MGHISGNISYSNVCFSNFCCAVFAPINTVWQCADMWNYYDKLNAALKRQTCNFD